MEPTRSTLLTRLADSGDQEAWSTFDRLYRPMLVGFSRTLGLSEADAEDVAQHCIQQCVVHIADYHHRHVGSFKGWLRKIAENRICDLSRRRQEQTAASGVLAIQPDDQVGPAEHWERHWLTEHLRFCLEQVRPDVAEHTYWAFYYAVVEDLPVPQIAQRLGMSANQIYVAKFRVLERIRTMLQDLSGIDVCGL